MMLRRELLEIRRKLAEVKTGFEVEDDPWEIVEKLLEETETLQQRLNTAFNCGYVEP